MGRPLTDPYPPRDMPYSEKDQPFAYGNEGDTDGGLMPSTPDPAGGVPDSEPPDNDRSVG